MDSGGVRPAKPWSCRPTADKLLDSSIYAVNWERTARPSCLVFFSCAVPTSWNCQPLPLWTFQEGGTPLYRALSTVSMREPGNRAAHTGAHDPRNGFGVCSEIGVGYCMLDGSILGCRRTWRPLLNPGGCQHDSCRRLAYASIKRQTCSCTRLVWLRSAACAVDWLTSDI